MSLPWVNPFTFSSMWESIPETAPKSAGIESNTSGSQVSSKEECQMVVHVEFKRLMI